MNCKHTRTTALAAGGVTEYRCLDCGHEWQYVNPDYEVVLVSLGREYRTVLR